jgi:pheromone shutdown protein TraB
MNQGEFKEKNNTLHHTLSELFYQNDTEVPSMVPVESTHDKELEHIRDNMEIDKKPDEKETFEEKKDDKNKFTKTILFAIIIVLITIVFIMYFVNNHRYQKMLLSTMDCNQFICV